MYDIHFNRSLVILCHKLSNAIIGNIINISFEDNVANIAIATDQIHLLMNQIDMYDIPNNISLNHL